MIDSENPGGVWALARFPALVVALTWSSALAAAVVLAPSQPILGALAAALAIPCLGLALLVRPALLAIALAFALMALGRAELPASDPQAASRAFAAVGMTASIAGRVADDSHPAAGGSEALVEPDQISIGGSSALGIGNLLVRWRGPTEAAFGDRIVASGKLAMPRDLPTFDRRVYLAQRHVYVEVVATNFNVVSTGAGLTALPGWLRTHYTAALDRALPAPHAAVLLGIVLGVRQGIPPSLQAALIATGLIHLLVLSGLKVAVFARIVQGALQPILGRHAAWPALALIGLYALAGGATPAAIRAAIMGCLAIVASRLGRPSHVWTSLALTAAAMLAWRPELAWDVGFQLSFAGTAAIILLTPGIERRLPRVPAVLREPFAVTCAAQVGTLPMMATDFHVLSPIAPLANAMTLPILPALVAAGLLLGPLAFAPDLARLVALPLAGLLAYVEQVSYLLAHAPAAAITVPRFPTWAGVAYYSALGPAIAGARSDGRRRVVALAAAILAPTLIAGFALGEWANAPPQVSVLAVGDGQAVLLRSRQGAILIDAGPSPQRLKDELGAQLPPWELTLDAIVITAPSLGHIGGFAGLNRAATVVLIPDAQLTGSAWRTAALEAAARGAGIARMQAGSTIRIAGFTLETIAPEPGAPGDVVGAAYLGIRAVASSGRSFCDLSDLDLDAQTVAAARLDGPCTYLLLPSGGRSLISPELATAAGTAAQLIASRSAGRLASGFPPTVLRTDQEGTITLPM
ncbi:MAG: ComEC/Rec2 family competence protein [Candidatus Dormibacteraeota bacterium]|nr:ComEC/Rec2 family competence protein [Candidatus Dormibacteraeota bacterium]